METVQWRLLRADFYAAPWRDPSETANELESPAASRLTETASAGLPSQFGKTVPTTRPAPSQLRRPI
eukprot:6461026-Pyramimonas_sp.AAC.1